MSKEGVGDRRNLAKQDARANGIEESRAILLDIQSVERAACGDTRKPSLQQATAMCFVDFAPAFDSVDRYTIWRIMAADGMPPKLLRLVRAYSSTKMKV